MKNVSHKKVWNSGMTQAHVEPPPIILINRTYDGKSDKYFVKLKLHRYPMFSTSDPYEFRIYLIDNDNPEDFLLFVRNFNMNLAASGTLETSAKIQYLRTVVHGEALRQFDSLSADV